MEGAIKISVRQKGSVGKEKTGGKVVRKQETSNRTGVGAKSVG